MFEYSAVLGSDLKDALAGQILPVLDWVRSSPWFWPVVVAVAVIVVLAARLITK